MSSFTTIESGQKHTQLFMFSQEDVNKFAALTGDKNPIHLDASYAEKTPFKKPIIHGILSAGIISKILGMDFPGEGSIYLKQDLNFKRPMYVGVQYEAILTVKEINKEKHQAIIDTQIVDKETGKVTITGEAGIMHKDKI